MTAESRVIRTAIILAVCFVWRPSAGWTFYKSDGLELRGFTGLEGGILHYPDDADLFPVRDDSLWLGALRLLLDARLAADITLEGNILQQANSKTNSGVAAQLAMPLDVERSGLFFWTQKNTTDMQAFLTLDVLALHIVSSKVDMALGRQPVNLATTFYFVPNDFFASFSALAFFREYKPGVDGVRLDIRTAPLSLLSIIGVLGYEPATGDRRPNRPDLSRTSLLLRYARAVDLYEVALIGGTVRDHTIAGASLQGEMAAWLGIRAEGHYAVPEKEGGDNYLEFSLGLEHRFANSLEIRIEQFYHGSGYDSIEEANRVPVHELPQTVYLGRHYTAVSVGYEFSPLFNSQGLVLFNWTDYSHLVSINTVYSLSDESELAITIILPGGDKPDGRSLRSEFGSIPSSLALTFRYFF